MDSEQNVRPVEYTVRLEPEFETDSFTGSVSFTLTEALADTTALVINCARIQIREALYRIGGRDEKWIPLEYSFDEDRETISLTFPTAIPRGQASTVRFGYAGRMEDNMEGLYKASYTDPKTAVVHQMAVTQMQANCARRVFPCFDEPAFKATFAVELVVPDGDGSGEGQGESELVCLGNMPIARTESITIEPEGDKKEQKKKKLVVFEKTPKMSTYLVAVAVGRLECIRSDSGRVPIAAWSPPGLREQTAFALQVAVRALALYEALFGIPYPLPKLDMLAVPDFSIGAMENWGLITFRTSCLCVDPVRSAVGNRRAVAETVAHELSHSWFGNLVTLDSWDGLWLNEGFASWMELFAAKQLFPEWPVWEDYVAETLQLALNCDALPSTHPVEMRIRDATEVDQVFDTISYQKGSCMVTMIAEDLGQDVFMAGVRAYLRRHAYGNASTAQLWQALAEASGRDVSAHMSVWTLTAGFPVITVREEEGGRVLRLHKQRFLSYRDPAAAPEKEEGAAAAASTYPLPLKIRTKGAGGRVETMVVDFPGTDATVTLPAGTTAYKLNPDQNAFLRTAYPAPYLAALPEGLLTVRDRVGIVADAAALAVTGDGSTAGLLDLLVALGAVEEEYVVWMQIGATLGKIRFAWVFADQPVLRGLRRLTREVVGRKFRQLGWALDANEADGGGGGGGGSVVEQFKALMFGLALSGKDPQAIEASRDMFARYVAGDQAAIHPGLKDEVFGAAVRNGGEAEFDALWHIYRTAESEDEKSSALLNLGMAIEPSLLRKLFDRVLGPDVKAQDFTHPLCCIPGSAPGARLLIDWARANWTTIEAALTPSLMASVVAVATNCLESGAELDEFVDWAARQEGYKTYDKAVRENTERARARRAWPDRCGDEVEAWLEAKGWLGDPDV